MTDKTPGTIAALRGARAFPPLIIVLFHYAESHRYSGLGWFDLIVSRGYLWVEFFFALSGFVLTFAYAARLAELWKPSGYAAFLKARLIRLYPLHLAILAILVAMVICLRWQAQRGGYVSIFDTPGHYHVEWFALGLNLLLVQAWNTLPYLSWNRVAWFVSVEFALCLLFPALLVLARGRSWRGPVLIAAGGAGLVALSIVTPGLDMTFHNGVLRGLCDFIIGMGMAVCFRALKARDRLPEHIHSLLQLAMLGVLALALWKSGPTHRMSDIFTALPLMLLVLLLAFDRGVLARLLQTRLPQKLGDWSYAIYMGQTVWLLGMRALERSYYPGGTAALPWWPEPLVLLLVCIAWGGLLESTIEMPAARYLRRRLSRRERRLDPPAIPTPS